MECLKQLEVIDPRTTAQLAAALDIDANELSIRVASGGHMAYRHLIIDLPSWDLSLFAKHHDESLFTDRVRSGHALEYLKKEFMFYNYLQAAGFSSIPQRFELANERSLLLDNRSSLEGWHWRIPEDPTSAQRYVEDVLASLDELQIIALPEENHFFPKRILKVYHDEGWQKISSLDQQKINNLLKAWRGRFRPEHQESSIRLGQDLEPLIEHCLSAFDTARQLYLSHHDARQANITWHEKHGVNIVDWSWADVGYKNADKTMFLIDIAKSGFAVGPLLKEHFNPAHALILLGHWLGRSTEMTKDGDNTVRFHQLASAVTAYDLLSSH